MNRLTDWWAGRSLREQRMLMGLGALVVLLVVWFGVIAPLRAWKADAAERYERAARDHAVVEAALAQVRAGGPALPGAEVERMVRASAETRGLALATIRAEGEAVGVTLEAVPTAAAFGWTAALEGEHGLSVRSFSASGNPDGSLNVQLAVTGRAR